MLYPVSVVVPTLYGRTPALLYDVPHALHGVVLVEPSAMGDTLVRRICDEVSLYLRDAEVSVLRLTSPHGLSATHYAADIVGSVALLRQNGASRVVLVATTGQVSSPLNGIRIDEEATADDVSDSAYQGFLDLITERAITPRAYAELIAELVDTIRDVIDAIVGAVHLVPAPPARGEEPMSAHQPARASCGAGVSAPESHSAHSAALTLALCGDGARGAVDYIAQLFAWVTHFLRTQRKTPSDGVPGVAQRESLEAYLARRRALLSDEICQSLELAWHKVVEELVGRHPELATPFAELERLAKERARRPWLYGRGWVFFDQRARLDWRAACAHVFPQRSECLPSGRGGDKRIAARLLQTYTAAAERDESGDTFQTG